MLKILTQHNMYRVLPQEVCILKKILIFSNKVCVRDREREKPGGGRKWQGSGNWCTFKHKKINEYSESKNKIIKLAD